MQKYNFLTNDVVFGTQSCFGPSVFISDRDINRLNSLVDEIKKYFQKYLDVNCTVKLKEWKFLR